MNNPVCRTVCSSGEYISFSFYLTNNGKSTITLKSPHAKIDGGDNLGWMDFSLAPGESTLCHIYNLHMKKVTPGLHYVQFFANGKELGHAYLGIDRDWSEVFTIPSSSKASSYVTSERSPYVYGFFDFPSGTKFSEFVIDFKIDYCPYGSYACLANWYNDISNLNKKYSRVDMEGPNGYCGFQNTEIGKGKCAIMSMWDMYCINKNGTIAKTIRPTCLSKPSGFMSKPFSGEGEGMQCLGQYNWETNTWYRLLLQSYEGNSGNTVIDLWLEDLSTETWSQLISYDLGVADAPMTTSAVFLENYLTQYAGEVRTLEFCNVRYKDAKSGQWKSVKSIPLSVAYGEGSWSAGSDGSCVWIITSGIKGLERNNKTTNCKLTKCINDNPY